MDKKKYLEELLEGAGHLNQFPMKTTDKSPDYGGYIKIEDKIIVRGICGAYVGESIYIYSC